MQEQELQQRINAESTVPTIGSGTTTVTVTDGKSNVYVSFKEEVPKTSLALPAGGPDTSLPALAVVCANACDSPTFLNIKARLLQEKQSGEYKRLKKLSHLSPITVPQRAIAEFHRSPSSGSPTPTDFSPMLLPQAEENLTALISEHNQQTREKQLQLQQQQQIQFQLQPIPPLIGLPQPSMQQLKRTFDFNNTNTPPVQPSEEPSIKRVRFSKRGRKRQREVASSSLGACEQPIVGTVVGSRVAPRRSSLGTMAVSVDTEAPPAGGTVMRKGPWLPDEDAKLLELVEQFGAYDWSFIADHIPGRVGKQCRERYFNHLAPDVRKEAWTDHEDDAIVHAHHVVGNKWTNIAKMLGNGRSPNSIKNRWHSSLKNRLAEHGGEASVMEATGAASGCKCDCKRCECSCKVACVAFGCQCCSALHSNTVPSEVAEDAQIITASTATDDDELTGGSGSTSSSTLTTPHSATSSAPIPVTGTGQPVVFSSAVPS